MNKYRVVSNGLNYRAQWLGKTWILRRSKWYWLLEYGCPAMVIATFSSEAQAQTAIESHIEEIKAKKQGYIPVQEGRIMKYEPDSDMAMATD